VRVGALTGGRESVVRYLGREFSQRGRRQLRAALRLLQLLVRRRLFKVNTNINATEVNKT